MLVSSLSRTQWRRLIENLQEIARELKQAKQEREQEDKERENKK